MDRPISCLTGLLLLTACTPTEAPTPPPSLPAAPAAAHLTSAGVTRIDLGTLGGRSSYAVDVNDAGVVVGWSELPDGSRAAFRWTRAGGMRPLPLLEGFTESEAISITPRGDILGRIWTTRRDPSVDVVWWAAGGVLRLHIPSLPGSRGMFAEDRNDAGEVVGYTDLNGPFHTWIWSQREGIHDITLDIPNTSETYAGNINRRGVMAGIYNDCNSSCNYRAFLWSRRHGYSPLGLSGEFPRRETQGLGSVDDRGTVVGWLDPRGNSNPVPFVWRAASGFTLLPCFSSSFPYGYAMAMNLDGTVVGASASRERWFTIQAAAWPRDGGIISLNGSDPNPSVAMAINRAGLAAGWSSLQQPSGPNHATAWIISPEARGSNPRPETATRKPGAAARPVERGIEGCLTRVGRLPTRAALLDCVLTLTD